MKLEFPQPPVILDKDKVPKVSILVGTEENQIAFLTRRFVKAYPQGNITHVDALEDRMILGTRTPTLWLCDSTHQMTDVADETLTKMNVFSATQMKSRSAGCNSIVKYAHRLLQVDWKLSKDQLDHVGDRIVGERFTGDLDTLIIDAMDMLLTPPTVEIKKEDRVEPWADPIKWIIPSESLYYRLHRLYKVVVGYVFARLEDWPNAKRIGVSPAQFAWLKTLRLNDRMVEETIVHLSRWRNHKIPTENAAMLIVATWSKN